MDTTSFGQYISQVRGERNMSQRKLADAAGLTNSTVSRIENDIVKPDVSTISKIAEILGISKEILLTKCGYSEIPEDFVIIARKIGDLTVEQRKAAYEVFNSTIDKFLDANDEEE